ncbi:MAG TPA: VIT1/CCC1 transporter family protein [Pirellulales bacterium]|jgi:VIT1/CCC1 family predicted Fe2+/Mn2+ transporter|nr:VIT1/CCC1 transporter family protein [Pirellulales bacterium]
MPTTPHIEKHFTATETIRDIVIGMSDGLTVPFALAAGLTGVVGSTSALVVTAGLAEVAAGSIAMGLGGYLAARTDAEHYEAERRREFREIEELPRQEEQEVADVFRGYGLAEEHVAPVVAAISAQPERWVDFMMRFELGLEAPNAGRARTSAMTIALSYIVGGLIPLVPYMFVADISAALWSSIALTLAALFVFGFIKGKFTGIVPLRGGWQTVLIGGLAAAAAFGIARAVG